MRASPLPFSQATDLLSKMQLPRPLDTSPVPLSCAIRAGKPARHGIWTPCGGHSNRQSHCTLQCSNAVVQHVVGQTNCCSL